MKQKRPVEMKPYLLKAFLATYEGMMGGKRNYRQKNKNDGDLHQDSDIFTYFILDEIEKDKKSENIDDFQIDHDPYSTGEKNFGEDDINEDEFL